MAKRKKPSRFTLFAEFMVTNRCIDNFVSAVIGLNAIGFAMLAMPENVVSKEWADCLRIVDVAFLIFFCVEVSTRIFLMLAIRERLKKTTQDILLDGWNIFDITTVAIAFIPGLGALRTFRLLRLIGKIPQFKNIVTNLLRACRFSMSIFSLSLLLIFVSGVTATLLFGAAHPESFGHLGRSMMTLYHLMYFDDLNQIMSAVVETHSWGWIFFVVYPVVMGVIILSLLLGIILDTMSSTSMRETHYITRKDMDAMERRLTKLLKK